MSIRSTLFAAALTPLTPTAYGRLKQKASISVMCLALPTTLLNPMGCMS